jgi:hypothetical protein
MTNGSTNNPKVFRREQRQVTLPDIHFTETIEHEPEFLTLKLTGSNTFTFKVKVITHAVPGIFVVAIDEGFL